MDETQEAQAKNPSADDPPTADLINAFIEITSSSKQEALFFLESHNFNLDAAVSTFLESAPDPVPAPAVNAPTRSSRRRNRSPSDSPPPSSSPERSPSRSRSQSPPASVELEPPVNSYNLRSRRSDNKASGSISRAARAISDLNRPSRGDDSGSDSDESEEYDTDGKKSGNLVQDSSKVNDVEALFNQPSSRPRSLSGRARRKSKKPFQGSGRTLGSTSCTETEEKTVPESSLTTAPPRPLGVVVDQSMPSTSIQLRLVDGTRLISSFNLHHTISDIRSFIDASRPDDGQRAYQLQIMGFPPKQLTDLNQTIEEAGLANTVVIQKL